MLLKLDKLKLNKLKLNKLINNGILSTIVEIFPNSLVNATKFLNIDRNDFHGMIVCPKCHSTYSCEDCFELECLQLIFKSSRGRQFILGLEDLLARVTF